MKSTGEMVTEMEAARDFHLHGASHLERESRLLIEKADGHRAEAERLSKMIDAAAPPCEVGFSVNFTTVVNVEPKPEPIKIAKQAVDSISKAAKRHAKRGHAA